MKCSQRCVTTGWAGDRLRHEQTHPEECSQLHTDFVHSHETSTDRWRGHLGNNVGRDGVAAADRETVEEAPG